MIKLRKKRNPSQFQILHACNFSQNPWSSEVTSPTDSPTRLLNHHRMQALQLKLYGLYSMVNLLVKCMYFRQNLHMQTL